MLSAITIQNFAIIDRLEIIFSKGLNILTGETGAGKSIIIDAIELIFGKKASASQIRDGADESAISASFDISGNLSVADLLNEIGIPATDSGEIILRRIVSRSGKNRSYVNDNPVSLTILTKLGRELMEIHGQHEHQSILYHDKQRDLLDAYADLLDYIEEYKNFFNKLKTIKKEISDLKKTELNKEQKIEYLNFQKNDIESTNLKVGEESELERERTILSNSEKLSSLSNTIHQLLYSTDDSILSKLDLIKKDLQELEQIDKSTSEGMILLSPAIEQLKELSDFIRNYKEDIEFNPQRLEEIEERIDLIKRLKKKYGQSVEEILIHLENVKVELNKIEKGNENILSLEKESQELTKKVNEMADCISQKRKLTAAKLEKEIELILRSLKMEKSIFKICITEEEPDNEMAGLNLSENGKDIVEFLISPNKGEELKLLSKIASGGELSRIMLAIKTILARTDKTPVLVFDEVDSGIGGAVAEIVGRKMKEISTVHQVFCITHLPQIASFADYHYRVEKMIKNDRTVTTVRELNPSQRLEEIGRMLGGEKITELTLKHAEEMLNRSV